MLAAIYEGANGIHALMPTTRVLRHANAAAADTFESWLDREGQGGLLGCWREQHKKVPAMTDHGEVTMSFTQETIDACRQTVAAKIARLD